MVIHTLITVVTMLTLAELNTHSFVAVIKIQSTLIMAAQAHKLPVKCVGTQL